MEQDSMPHQGADPVAHPAGSMMPLIILMDHEGAFLPDLASREQIRLGVTELRWLAKLAGHPGAQPLDSSQIGEDKAVIVERLVHEIESRRTQAVEEQIHVAWYCLRWSDRRLEDGQAEVIRAIAATGVPVILVMTQVPQQGGLCHPDAAAPDGPVSLPLAGPAATAITAPSSDADPLAAMSDTLPDRLSVDPSSPFHDEALLARGIGIRFKGEEKTNVEEYCISEGWVRLALGNRVDRKGKALTVKLQGPVEAFIKAE